MSAVTGTTFSSKEWQRVAPWLGGRRMLAKRRPPVRHYYPMGYLTDGKRLIWEYPRDAGKGEQLGYQYEIGATPPSQQAEPDRSSPHYMAWYILPATEELDDDHHHYRVRTIAGWRQGAGAGYTRPLGARRSGPTLRGSPCFLRRNERTRAS